MLCSFWFCFSSKICFFKSGKLFTSLHKNPVYFFKIWETVVKPWTRQSNTKSLPCLQLDGSVVDPGAGWSLWVFAYSSQVMKSLSMDWLLYYPWIFLSRYNRPYTFCAVMLSSENEEFRNILQRFFNINNKT